MTETLKPADDVVEAVARALYECERARSDNVDKLLSAAKGQPVKFRMEHWDDVAGLYRSDAIAAISAIPTERAWQDIASAPSGETVDVWIAGPAPRRMPWCRKGEDGHWYHSECGCRGWSRLDLWATPTHWQPLPAPPVLSPREGE